MPNTNLPTNIVAGATTGFAADASVAWGEINRLSRDTGWRDVTGLIANGWVVSSARIRRVDDRVTLELAGLDSASSTSATIIPFGTDESTQLSSNLGPDIVGVFRLPIFEASTGRVQFYGNSASGLNAAFLSGTNMGSATLQITWSTFRAWPSFLPPAV